MNAEFLKWALKRVEEITDEELYEIGLKCGLEMTIRQYPEPEEPNEKEDQ